MARTFGVSIVGGIGRSSALVVMVFIPFSDHIFGSGYPFGLETSRREDGTAQVELRLLCRLESCIPESPTG